MTAEPYRVSFQVNMFRVVMRPLFRGLFHILAHVRITGTENVPKGEAYLIAMNHVSLYEPPFLLAFWPVAPEAVGAVDIWSRRGQSTLARLYGGIPVHRGEYDRELIETMLAALNSGRPLAIAPEGGRSHSPGMRRALPGVAYAIDLAGVPVVPVGILGTSDDFMQRALHGPHPKLEMRIGRPVRLPPIEGKGEERRLARQRNADIIMIRIARLLPVEYHGVYAGLLERDYGY
jgi:1-acyl-sn-glycerol-3-phosphate acyltransferase